MIINQLVLCEECRDGTCRRCRNFKRRQRRKRKKGSLWASSE